MRAAFAAEKEHPVRGREFFGQRTRVSLPSEGELDYVLAQEAREAADEVIRASQAALDRDEAVDRRIAEVYSKTPKS